MDQLIENFSLQGNWVDVIFLLVLLYFILTNRGFIHTILDVLGFLFSLLLSYRLYAFFGKIIAENFTIPRGIANAVGFFIAWFIAEIILYLIFTSLYQSFLHKLHRNPVDKSLGYLAGAIQACIIFLFFISLIFALPVRGQVKQAIMESRTGPYFVNISQSTERRLKNVFGDAISETINFLTIKPQSNETVDLGFKLKENQLSVDETSEEQMLKLVNNERRQRGLPELRQDNQLRTVARAYAKEMFINGFFAHTSQVDGSNPGERANRYNVEYQVLGENLAYAPDVYIAHQGLMNSEGHRKNILSPEYSRVGIGVIDGGYYGKMFVQEFRD